MRLRFWRLAPEWTKAPVPVDPELSAEEQRVAGGPPGLHDDPKSNPSAYDLALASEQDQARTAKESMYHPPPRPVD